MPVQRKRIIELALENLLGEKSRIDAEIAELRSQLRDEEPSSKRTTSLTKTKSAQSKKGKQNLKTSSKMKQLWAKARKAGFTNLKDYKASLGQ